MKYYLLMTFIILFLLVTFSLEKVNGQCPENPDELYNREQVLNQLIGILNNSVPNYSPKNPGFYITNYENAGGFFVYDLSDTTNNDTPATRDCINFINNHIYHFAPVFDHYSASHILILEDGKIKVFKSINCSRSSDQLVNVISYLKPKLKDNKNKDEILVRVKNYRKYGSYITSDYPRYYCENSKPVNHNNYIANLPDIFEDKNALREFSRVLNSSILEYKKYFVNGFFTEGEKAVGFFVYDLTDPNNKQTSQDELVYFVKNHIYHFAPIDLPWSFSFIAVLGENEMKIFKAINCEGKGDSLEDVIGYLNEKLQSDKNKDEIIKRVKNYRKYGVYASFNGISSPQCEQLEIKDNNSNKDKQKLECKGKTKSKSIIKNPRQEQSRRTDIRRSPNTARERARRPDSLKSRRRLTKQNGRKAINGLTDSAEIIKRSQLT